MNSTDIKAVRDRLGFNRLFFRTDEPAYADSIAALLSASDRPAQLDREGTWSHLQDGFHSERTCFAGIACVPVGHGLIRHKNTLHTEAYISLIASYHASVIELLSESLRSFALQGIDRSAFVLDGSVESAVLLHLLQEQNDKLPPVYIMHPEMAGPSDYYYDDVHTAHAIARHFNITPIVVSVNENDFLSALPGCVKAAESPFHNLHVVWWYLLSKRLQADGIQSLACALGANQAFTHTESQELLPLVGGILASTGLEATTPFLEEDVIAHLKRQTADPHKWYLRHMIKGTLPDRIVMQDLPAPSAPAMDLTKTSYLPQTKIKKLASEIGLPEPKFNDHASAVKWATLLLLREQLVGNL